MNTARKGIVDFYKGKNIFVTGSTGFLGTSLVEKLLRSFPEVNQIYLLVRNKKNKSASERYSAYFNKKIFSEVSRINRNFASRVTLIDGDLTAKSNLGLSTTDLDKIRKDTNVVFHCAAIVNFSESLKETLQVNLKATHDLLNIFKEKNNLASFMYVSTIYSASTRTRLESLEKLYPPVMDPIELLNMVENRSEIEIENNAKKLIKSCMNYYTFSKNASEYLVNSYKEKIPVGIFRPGAIISSLKEPFPYWIQGALAYEKILLEIDKGLIYKCNFPTISACVPIDMTTNALIAAAYDTHRNKRNVKIYNYSGNSANPIYLQKTVDYYVSGINKLNLLLSRLHYNCGIPVEKFFNKNSKSAFNKLKFKEFLKIAESFTNKEFIMENKNIQEVWASMNEEERKLLFCSLDDVDWKSYYTNMSRGRIVDDC